MSFDNPSLVGTLASNVGAFRAQEVGSDQALNWARFNQNADAQQQQLNLQRQRMIQPQPAPAAPPPPTPAWTEVDPQGTTIYHPQGEAMPANMQGGAAQGMGAQNPRNNSAVNQYGAYSTPQQRTWLAQIDQMEQGGQLQSTEAARWRMMVQAGKDPFSNKTIGEEESLRGAGKADPNSLNQKQSADEQLRGSEQTAKLEEQEYQRQRQAIHDQIGVLQHRATDPLTSSADRQKANAAIDGLMQSLKDLAGSGKRSVTPDTIKQIIDHALGGGASSGASKRGDDTPPVQLQGKTITNVGTTPAKSAALAPDVDETKAKQPVTRAVMQKFLQLAGNDPQKAKALAAQAGFDPNTIAPDPVQLQGNRLITNQ